MPDNAQSIPSSLSAIRSEFQILCDEQGAPVPLSTKVETSTLEWACREFGFNRAWDAYRAWQPDEATAKRHWPWVALAAAQYQFERDEKAKYTDEPKPSELTALVNGIATGAKSLADDLLRLQTLSFRLSDPETPERRWHLAWIREYIAQSLAAGPRGDIDKEDPDLFAAGIFAIPQFCKRLAWVEAAAKSALERISPELLKRVRTQSDRGLGNLVWRCAVIWESLTGRHPSTNRVWPRKGSNDDRPDFAIFVINVAKMACGREPSLDEIDTAFKRRTSHSA